MLLKQLDSITRSRNLEKNVRYRWFKTTNIVDTLSFPPAMGPVCLSDHIRGGVSWLMSSPPHCQWPACVSVSPHQLPANRTQMTNGHWIKRYQSDPNIVFHSATLQHLPTTTKQNINLHYLSFCSNMRGCVFSKY